MPPINEIIRKERPAGQIIGDLQQKTISVPSWGELEKEYNPKQHPVYNKKEYADKCRKGKWERMTRVTYAIQKQAVKRMKELMFTIPVKRKYTTKSEQEKKAATIMEAIFKKNHIDSVNLKRAHRLFASCEIITIWFAQKQDTIYAGETSKLKLRCRTYSPMDGDELYPLFDEYDDMIALSIAYSRYEGQDKVNYFDTYTADAHYRWRQTAKSGTDWELDTEPEPISIQKIQGCYLYRPEPIWEDQSDNGYELEWALSRNGNYLRKNSRPTWVIYTDSSRPTNPNKQEPADDNAGRNILRYGQKDRAEYATWNQAIESLKFHTEELRRNIHTTLQLPDMSMEQMKATPMSGEARKMLFIDCQMKVTDEAGDWIEFFDREVNVVREFCKLMFPKLAGAFDTLTVENVITPYQINSLSDDIKDGTNATNGKAVASRRTIVRRLGLVPEEELEDELEQIEKEEQTTTDLFNNEPTE